MSALDELRERLEAASSTRRRDRVLADGLPDVVANGDPAALEFAREVARDPNSSAGTRGRAIDALRRAGPAAAPHLRALVADGTVDPALPWALAETGTAEDAQMLLPFLSQRGLRLRVNTVVALDRLGVPVTHEGFRLALTDRRLFVRASAMSALRERCTDAELLDAIEAARREVPWHRLLTRRYFTLWARRPLARELRRRQQERRRGA